MNTIGEKVEDDDRDKEVLIIDVLESGETVAEKDHRTHQLADDNVLEISDKGTGGFDQKRYFDFSG